LWNSDARAAGKFSASARSHPLTRIYVFGTLVDYLGLMRVPKSKVVIPSRGFTSLEQRHSFPSRWAGDRVVIPSRGFTSLELNKAYVMTLCLELGSHPLTRIYVFGTRSACWPPSRSSACCSHPLTRIYVFGTATQK